VHRRPTGRDHTGSDRADCNCPGEDIASDVGRGGSGMSWCSQVTHPSPPPRCTASPSPTSSCDTRAPTKPNGLGSRAPLARRGLTRHRLGRRLQPGILSRARELCLVQDDLLPGQALPNLVEPQRLVCRQKPIASARPGRPLGEPAGATHHHQHYGTRANRRPSHYEEERHHRVGSLPALLATRSPAARREISHAYPSFCATSHAMHLGHTRSRLSPGWARSGAPAAGLLIRRRRELRQMSAAIGRFSVRAGYGGVTGSRSPRATAA